MMTPKTRFTVSTVLSRRNAAVLAGLICLGFFLSEPGILASRQARAKAANSQASEEALRARQAHGKGGLGAAAAVDGRFTIQEYHLPKGAPLDFGELLDLTETVVVATVHGNLSELSTDQMTITTRYELVVERVLRGDQQSGDRISLVLPGGRASFGGGRFAQVDTPGYLRPNAGNRLLLFLKRNEGDTYTPNFGPLGVYNLSQTMKPFMMPSGAFKTLLARTVVAEKMSAEQLVSKVSGLIASRQ